MKASKFICELEKYNIGPYVEVPCSILSPIIDEVTYNKKCEVYNPANEAIGAGIVSGSYLASGKIPVLLIQNSGLCNTLNALTSLNILYKIPVLIIISWRGEPGLKDAPEHKIIGEKLEGLLKLFNIPYKILSTKSYKKDIQYIMNKIKATSSPGVLLLKDRVVDKKIKSVKIKNQYGMTISDAIRTIILSNADKKNLCYITTNGFISREAYNVISVHKLEKIIPVFYMMGSMGHALSIGIGLHDYLKKNKKTIVLDGDGGCLMHMGSMASIDNAKRLIHVVLDNGVYASTGNQLTLSRNIDFKKIASGCGYKVIRRITSIPSLKRAISEAVKITGPSFIHISIENLQGTPKSRVSDKYSCDNIKQSFMELLKNKNGTTA